MLTKEALIANEALKGLNDDQVKAIITLSERDENNVIAQKTGQIYTNLEQDIIDTSGLKKESGERAFNFMKRAITHFKELSNDNKLGEELEKLKAEKLKLEKQLQEGKGDEGLKNRVQELENTLKEKEATISEMQSSQSASIKEWEEKINQSETKLLQFQIDSNISSQIKDFEFKSDLPKEMVNVFVKSQVEKLKKDYKIELARREDGDSFLIFKDQNGGVVHNKTTLLPKSAKDFLAESLDSILEKGKQQTGTGTKAGQSKSTQGAIVSGTTQIAVRAELEQQASSLGYSQGSKEYDTFIDEAWEANNVAEMPIQ